jgi:antitoxin (DNA-binding transcriptional repressor) of toxin-antitoxin stability system
MDMYTSTYVRRHLAKVLRKINSSGQSVLIADYGEPVALLSPLPEDFDRSVAVAVAGVDGHTL